MAPGFEINFARIRSICTNKFLNMITLRKAAWLLGMLGLLGACGNHKPQADALVRKVKIGSVELADTVEVRSYPALLREAGEISLAFRVAGPIAHIAVKEGDYVQAGQLIARMDPRDYQIQLQAAQAQYEQVKAEAERVIELHNRQSVSGNDYDKAVSGLRMVEAQLKHAQDQLNDTRLVAPVAGYIQKVNFRTHELVDAGMPVATLVDVSQYLVETDIPAALYARRDDMTGFWASQPLLSDQPLALRLLSISRKASQNQLYRVQLAVEPSASVRLSPGMDVQLHIALRQQGAARMCIPLTALFKEGDKTLVWVYQPHDGTVQAREVIPGNTLRDGRIQLIAGLQAGEQIVVAGVSLLNPNDRVEPLEPVSQTNIGGLL